MDRAFAIYHEYETLRERLGVSPTYSRRDYNAHEEIMRELTQDLNLGWIAKWCRDWAPVVALQEGYDTRPEIALLMEMTIDGNLRISWTPVISRDQYEAAPRACQIWFDELHRKEAFQSPRSELHFIRGVRQIEAHLDRSCIISDPELSTVAIKALDAMITDLPRKLKHFAKSYWQDYLFIEMPDQAKGTPGRFDLVDAWEYQENAIEEGIRSLEEGTGFTEETLKAALGNITQSRPRIKLIESKLKAVAEGQGISPEHLQSLHARYKRRDKFQETMKSEHFCREPHPGRWDRRHMT